MKYSFDINKVNLVNLNGIDKKLEYESSNDIPFCKIIGNLIYENISDLDMEDLAKKIHAGQSIEMSEREQKIFIEIINNINVHFLKRRILAQITEIR